MSPKRGYAGDSLSPFPMIATARFDVTSWEPTVYDQPEDGPALTRVTLTKTFEGDLTGESVGEGLFCGLQTPAEGAGYMVSERVTGRLGGRAGTFVMQHGGLAAPEAEPQSFGSIVPGSGTGALAGLRGTVVFGADHTITLKFEMPDGPADAESSLAT